MTKLSNNTQIVRVDTHLHVTADHARIGSWAGIAVYAICQLFDLLTSCFGITSAIGLFNFVKQVNHGVVSYVHPANYVVVMNAIGWCFAAVLPILFFFSIFRDSSGYYERHAANRSNETLFATHTRPEIISTFNEIWSSGDYFMSIVIFGIMCFTDFTGAISFLHPVLDLDLHDLLLLGFGIIMSLAFTIGIQAGVVILPFRIFHTLAHEKIERRIENIENRVSVMEQDDMSKFVNGSTVSSGSKNIFKRTKPADALPGGSSTTQAPPIKKGPIVIDDVTPTQASLLDDDEDEILATRQKSFSAKR